MISITKYNAQNAVLYTILTYTKINVLVSNFPETARIMLKIPRIRIDLMIMFQSRCTLKTKIIKDLNSV